MSDDPPVKQAAPPRACPVCGKPRTEKYRPFCSKRCADVDLGRWLGGAYRIEAGEGDEAEMVERADETKA